MAATKSVSFTLEKELKKKQMLQELAKKEIELKKLQLELLAQDDEEEESDEEMAVEEYFEIPMPKTKTKTMQTVEKKSKAKAVEKAVEKSAEKPKAKPVEKPKAKPADNKSVVKKSSSKYKTLDLSFLNQGWPSKMGDLVMIADKHAISQDKNLAAEDKTYKMVAVPVYSKDGTEKVFKFSYESWMEDKQIRVGNFGEKGIVVPEKSLYTITVG
jgi:outer membrane biosynthesis protein TonB